MVISSASRQSSARKSQCHVLIRLPCADSLHRVHDYEAQGLYATPIAFYEFLQNRVLVYFKPKNEEVSDENPEFELILSKKMNYDIVRFSRGAELILTHS